MEAGPGGGKALRGIYRLKDDILLICYDEADRERPATFAGDKPSERLIILRRRPPAPGPRPGGLGRCLRNQRPFVSRFLGQLVCTGSLDLALKFFKPLGLGVLLEHSPFRPRLLESRVQET